MTAVDISAEERELLGGRGCRNTPRDEIAIAALDALECALGLEVVDDVFLGYLLFGKDAAEGALQPAGIVGSIIGAVIALLVYRALNRRRTV